MPEFLDSLIEDVRRKSVQWQEVTTGSIDSRLAQMLDPIALENWHQLPLEETSPPEGVIGTDGSRAARTLWNGAVWWIVRAVAICGSHRARVLESGFVRGGIAERDADWYFTLRMEGAENAAALDGARRFNGKFILVDGSLFGRLQHTPLELTVSDERGYLLSYYDTLFQLLDCCRENGIGLIGISKDSGISQFTRYLLLQKMTGLLKTSKEKPSIRVREGLKNAIMHPDNPKGAGFSLMMTLLSKKDALWTNAAEILRLALLPVSDHVVMQSLLKGKGYTTPLIFSLNESFRAILDSAIENSTEFVDTRFARFIAESPDPQNSRKYAMEIIWKLKNLPSVISFHVRLHPRDTPLRVDIPGWMVGDESKIWEHHRPKAVNCDLSEVMRVLTGGYGGLQNYNIWQKRADEIARLPRETMDNLYRQAIEREIGHHIEFRRSYRRVNYP